MSTPINPSTDKVEQSFFPISLKPSSPTTFPIAYADNVWDVVTELQQLAPLAEATGQFDQHTINELLAAKLLQIAQQGLEVVWLPISGEPTEHHDFTDDFTDDFD